MENRTTNIAGDDKAVELLSVTNDFGDRYAEVTAWEIPQSDRYPDGIKYSMQYGTASGKTIVRYDNFPDHPEVGHHHKHRADGNVETIEFEGLYPLFEQFKREVTEHGHTW